MKYNNYAHIELKIISKNKNNLGNSANYKNLAQWNNSDQGNVTTVGLNGDPNYYGLFDISGQLYEWTDSHNEEHPELKICRGGSYIDYDHINLSKEVKQEFYYDLMLQEGIFGFRVASINNPYNYNNFVIIENVNNLPDKCDNTFLGSVNYEYQINKYLVTNSEYCEFLNSIDPEATNKNNLYDVRMSSSSVGGIFINECAEIGQKYTIKTNMSNKPVTFITWLMAIKYINWLHHNKSNNIEDIYNGAYDISNGADVSRSQFAEYFLPNENEWYKAAYFDPNKNNIGPGYWKYGTKNDSAPLAILSDSQGNAQYVENYHYSEKTFPILFNKNFDSFEALATEEATPADPCPIIQITGVAPTDADNYLYFINSTISNLEYNTTYDYNFTSSFANWPCKITPLSGSFKAYGKSQEINAIIEFCPINKENILNCNNNLNYSDLNEDDTNFYIDLALNVKPQNSCNFLLTENYVAELSGLPSGSIVNNNEIFNVEFLDSHENAIIVSGNLCCQPIPIVVSVSGHKPSEKYKYELFSSSPNVVVSPTSGLLSFSKNVGKFTAFALGLNNNISVLTTKVTKLDDDKVSSSDQVLLQCISDCEKSCENHANYKDKARWSPCTIEDCSDTFGVVTNKKSNVTTVGTNGGEGSYGTYDMDGNVWELVHAGNIKQNPATYKVRGGSFKSSNVGKLTVDQIPLPHEEVGFRIATYLNPHNYDNFLHVQDIESIGSGNKQDDTGFGSVNYPFQINKYEVTNCEYVEFLNSIALGTSQQLMNMVYYSGMSGCYGGINRTITNGQTLYYPQECMDHKPVRFVSEYAILKYINWINNNKPVGWTPSNSGTYLLDNTSIVSGNRIPCGDYFLPSENEWYKAAYYKGSNTENIDADYWQYSTQASFEPDPIVSVTECGDAFVKECPQPQSKAPCINYYYNYYTSSSISYINIIP